MVSKLEAFLDFVFWNNFQPHNPMSLDASKSLSFQDIFWILELSKNYRLSLLNKRDSRFLQSISSFRTNEHLTLNGVESTRQIRNRVFSS